LFRNPEQTEPIATPQLEGPVLHTNGRSPSAMMLLVFVGVALGVVLVRCASKKKVVVHEKSLV
jgi:hypothetical protein